MSAYFDTAYIAKCYVNEPDSRRVRAQLRRSGGGHSSSLCLPEMAAVLLRHVREGSLSRTQATKLRDDFEDDVADGIWTLVPVTDPFLARVAARVSTLRNETHVRAGDAIHLWAASEAGFADVWSNDRHLLAAAVHFGLRGRSV